MSDLALKITADTAAASMSFKDMASSSEVLQKKIAKLSEDLGKRSVIPKEYIETIWSLNAD